MRVALINGSPKATGSASNALLVFLSGLLGGEVGVVKLHLKSPTINEKDLNLIGECDVLVWAFPLYVDGVPGHLLSCLVQLEKYYSKKKTTKPLVCALVNCGFYEGNQAGVALEIMKNWTNRAGLTWGQGLGVGGGGMLASLVGVPLGQGPLKNLGKALEILTTSMKMGKSSAHTYIVPNFPRFAYKLTAEYGWRLQIRANGLKTKDLGRKIASTTPR